MKNTKKLGWCRVRFLAVFLAMAASGPARAEMEPVRKIHAGIPPYDVIRQITQYNIRTTDKAAPYPSRAQEEHTPLITWLTEPDDRIQPGLLFADPAEKVYTVRNMGAQITADSAAIDYGVSYLRAPVLLITGNTDSVAVRATAPDLARVHAERKDELLAKQKKPGKPPPGGIQEEDIDAASPMERLLTLVEDHVDRQVEEALARYGERVRMGRLAVVGGVIDLTDQYSRGARRLIIININGEKDSARLQRHPVAATLGQANAFVLGREHLRPGDKKTGSGNNHFR